MKTNYPIILLLSILFLSSCGSRNPQTALDNGNYDEAINLAISKLRGNKNAKRNVKNVIALSAAFEKAVEQDLAAIKRLELNPNEVAVEKVYDIYVRLQQRQDAISPLIPLQNVLTAERIDFKFVDYDQKVEQAKSRFSENILINAANNLASANKQDARKIYDDLFYLDEINPNYKNVRVLLNEARELGTNYVEVHLLNNTQQIIPVNLERELLDFSTYGLNNKWVVYHNQPEDSRQYDYAVNIDFVSIRVSPDQVLQKELKKERTIKDGFTYVYDRNGNVAKDSLGNDIKKDKFINVQATVLQSEQNKAVDVAAVVILKDLNTNQVVDRFPINSTFAFNYLHATIRGDRRALETQYLQTLNPRAVPFPTTEQMVYDAGEDLKGRIKNVLSRLKI